MLAKAGWWGASPSSVSSAPVDEVINAFYYEQFCNDYIKAEYELNKDYKK